MTNNNLTLDKWRKELNKHLLDCGITVASPFFCRFIRNFIKKLLSLQYQKDIEQFKNMESMKKEKHDSFCLHEDVEALDCDCGADEVNQKIDEILEELKVIEEEK